VSLYGLSPLGTDLGPFGGPGLITVLGALPGSTYSFTVVYDRIPDTFDPLSYYSATNPENYSLGAVDPTYTSATTTYIPPGGVVPTRFPSVVLAETDVDDPKQVHVYTDAKLEPRVEYLLEVRSNIIGSGGEAFAGPNTFSVIAPALQQTTLPQERREQRYRDLEYVILGDSPGYRFDETGDIAIHSAQPSLTKRIHRRIFSRSGDFAWAPDYGAGISVKALAKAGVLQSAADKIREQILREPDVQDAAVAVRIARTYAGAIIDIRASVRRADSSLVRVDISEPL
jgi:hypothetical protein